MICREIILTQNLGAIGNATIVPSNAISANAPRDSLSKGNAIVTSLQSIHKRQLSSSISASISIANELSIAPKVDFLEKTH
jgi:hypothetical protein